MNIWCADVFYAGVMLLDFSDLLRVDIHLIGLLLYCQLYGYLFLFDMHWKEAADLILAIYVLRNNVTDIPSIVTITSICVFKYFIKYCSVVQY